ncbi:MAG: hypothetical protein A2V85_11950 [Chloroflexi bacterium RBG_16_72_14]|nr:MAG: hypothetical protein A2V85_11950 [Chloroflexi bacterium RBG_16_72_14]
MDRSCTSCQQPTVGRNARATFCSTACHDAVGGATSREALLAGVATRALALPGMPNRIDRQIVGATLLVKLLLLGFGVVVVALLGGVIHPYPLGGLAADSRQLFEPWVRWDASNYLDVAVFGYRGNLIVFFPLYPWLVGALNVVVGDPTIAAFIVSGVASLFVGPILFRLVAADEGPAIALRSVWFFLIFPTAYFLHIGYAEALFMALALGSMLAARTDRWWWAGVLGALAALTRVNGVLLVPALAVEAVMQWWPERRGWRSRWLAIGMVPLGFLGYLALNQAVYGNPVAFLSIQAALWHRSLSPPWVGIGALFDPAVRAPLAWIAELAFVALALVGVIVSAFRFRPTWTVWMAGNLLLFTSTSVVLSVPRFSLLLFPLFVWFAVLARFRGLAVLITLLSLSALVLFAGRFALGTWAF